MDIDYIREFIILAETGSFMETAEKLFISQSSLTRHIKSLEEDLGATVFDRTTRNVMLNQRGRVFLPYAKEIVRIQYEYRTALYNILLGVHENVRVGSIPIMIPYGITDVLSQFQRENSAFSLDVVEADSSALVKMLRYGECTFAFISEADDFENEFNKLPYTSDVLVAIMREEHFLAHKEAIDLSQLAGEPLLLLSKDTFMYPLCVSECRKAGFEPRIVFTGRRVESIIDLVNKGMGIALLNRKASASLLDKGIVTVNIEPFVRSTICLAYPKKINMSEAAKHFLNLVKTYGYRY